LPADLTSDDLNGRFVMRQEAWVKGFLHPSTRDSWLMTADLRPPLRSLSDIHTETSSLPNLIDSKPFIQSLAFRIQKIGIKPNG